MTDKSESTKLTTPKSKFSLPKVICSNTLLLITLSGKGKEASHVMQADLEYWNKNKSEEQIRRARKPWKVQGPPADSTGTFPRLRGHIPRLPE